MNLVDSSIWIDHFRRRSHVLHDMLLQGLVLTHPFVVGELAMGSLKDRQEVLVELSKLPMIPVADDGEVLELVENFRIYSRGIGYLDAHLLASARLTPDTSLWTLDRRLREVAQQIGVAATLPGASLQ